jgi:hypothetical protein
MRGVPRTQFRNTERLMDGVGHYPMMPSLDDGRRRALKLLDGNSYGRTDSALLAHGIHPAVLIGLFNAALRRRASKRYPRVSGQSSGPHASQITPKGGKRSCTVRFEDAGSEPMVARAAAMKVR